MGLLVGFKLRASPGLTVLRSRRPGPPAPAQAGTRGAIISVSADYNTPGRRGRGRRGNPGPARGSLSRGCAPRARGAQSVRESLSHPSPVHISYIFIYVCSSPPLPNKTQKSLLVREVRTPSPLLCPLPSHGHTTLHFRTTSLSRDEHAPVTVRSAVYEPRRCPAPAN